VHPDQHGIAFTIAGGAPPVNHVISLRAHANGMIVTAENAGASPLIANRTAIGPWEQFDEIDLGNGNIAVRADTHSTQVVIDVEGASPGALLVYNMNYDEGWHADTGPVVSAGNAVATRIKNAEFPVEKDFDTFDFTALPGLSKPKVLELGRCEWIEQKFNCCLVGSHGTGKTHVSIGLGLAACRPAQLASLCAVDTVRTHA